MAALFILLVSIFTFITRASLETISLSLNNKDGQVQFYNLFGCGKDSSPLADNTVLEVEGGLSHNLFTSPTFCALSDLRNVTIQSSTNETTWLRCPGNKRTGFGFYNVSGLTLKNIGIDNCGNTVPGPLKKDKLGVDLFGPNQQAVLSISMSGDICLSNMEITNYSGFALISHTNVGQVRVHKVSIKNSYAFNHLEGDSFSEVDDWSLSGAGIVMCFIDADIAEDSDGANVVISNVVLVNNRIYFQRNFSTN